MALVLMAGGLAALAWLTVFQVLLALGVPLGRMAWGGGDRILSAGKRVASAVSAVVTALGCLCLTDALGVTDVIPDAARGLMLWALTGLFALSVLGNAASSSRIERLHGVPVALIITAGLAAAALG